MALTNWEQIIQDTLEQDNDTLVKEVVGDLLARAKIEERTRILKIIEEIIRQIVGLGFGPEKFEFGWNQALTTLKEKIND